MSLLLSSHHFHLSSKTSLHHHHHRNHHLFSNNIHRLNKTPEKTLILNSQLSNQSKTLPKSAIQRIAEKLRTLGFKEETKTNPHPQNDENNPEIGNIFIPNPRQIPNYRVGHTLDSSWSSPQNPVPDPGSGDTIVTLNGLSKVVKKERREERENQVKEKEPSLAELCLSGSELRRLRTMGIRIHTKMKLGKAGITEGVLNGIHERWRSCEVVKIVCEDICRLNMKRTHDLLEKKTGGMVVWRSGSKIVLYRGVNYKYPYFSLDEATAKNSSDNAIKVDDGMQSEEEEPSSESLVDKSDGQSSARIMGQLSLVPGVGSPGRVRFLLPGESQLVEEADRLLDGLGPRFTDWWGFEPLPIDADLLPAVVPGYRKPFRLLPYGVKPQLTNDEMTILKRLGRPLPCHFALGRNRNLQGLAAAILKLWEKCEIAKVAVKRGVQNTNSELMAEELKRLTGGVLLSRDKEYIVFYRGKDFLPSAVSLAIEQRRRNRMHGDDKVANDSSTETSDDILLDTKGQATISISESSKDQKIKNTTRERKLKSIQTTISRTSRKLSMAIEEKEKKEKLLSDLEQAEISQQAEVDKEGITEEERYMLRRVGLKMKPFLLLGRRGVFDGTIENMHLHWKYRELVKIICGGRDIDEIHNRARILEAESGGVLVAVERVRNGHAIIVYRGKNYQRPASLRPETLLNKKQALNRSIEAQRRESLKLNVLKLAKNIDELKLKLVKEKESLNNKMDEQEKTQLEPRENEPKSTISVHNKDFQEYSPSIQEEKLIKFSSVFDKTDEGEDKFSGASDSSETNLNSVNKAHADAEVSLCHDDPEAKFSDLIHVASSDSGNASCTESMFHSTSNKSEPMVSSVSINNFEHQIVKHEVTQSSQESDNKEVIPLSFHKVAESNSHADKVRPLTDKHSHPKNQITQSSQELDNKEVIPLSFHKVAESNSHADKARPLTNKERLLLRKQALKMKRRPVLAVGKSNVVSGVAKAIKDHFKKYPLAIVNVKGRAKGTSVQELVFKLEQETGGVLVSQEPSKIILYRGWGGGVETGHSSNKEDHNKRAGVPSLAVSPELLAAMKLECGLSSN